jgi:hypothetical protein
MMTHVSPEGVSSKKQHANCGAVRDSQCDTGIRGQGEGDDYWKRRQENDQKYCNGT